MIERLLALYAACLAAGEYEAAYHTVMSALHLADHSQDAAALDRLEEAAVALERSIEAVQPAHRLSSKQAQARGQQSLCQSLRVHIEAVRLRLRSEAQRERRSAAA